VWLHTGFVLVIGFTDRFNTRLITTSNYSAVGNLCTLQFFTAHPKPSKSFISRFPVTDLNGDSSVSMLTSLLSAQYPTTEVLLQTALVMTFRH
jgi:hypothetical protein